MNLTSWDLLETKTKLGRIGFYAAGSLPVAWWLYARMAGKSWGDFLTYWVAGYVALMLGAVGVCLVFVRLHPFLFEKEGSFDAEVVAHVSALSLSLVSLFAMLLR